MQIRTKILFKHMQFYKAFTTYSDSFSSYCYNGKEKDYERGVHYYGARYYNNSELSVWLSTDSMTGKISSLSPYNYCANNPVKLIDPNGKDIWAAKQEYGTYKITEGIQNNDKGKYI